MLKQLQSQTLTLDAGTCLLTRGVAMCFAFLFFFWGRVRLNLRLCARLNRQEAAKFVYFERLQRRVSSAPTYDNVTC